ncbi:MAG TPA: hypothetical protein VJ724_14510, partial [Tahibacter sp.]|nr:hypothetical protein [Tahibacter sp.]
MLSYRHLAALIALGAAFAVPAAGNPDKEFADAGRRVIVFDAGGDKMDDALAVDVASNGTVVVAGTARVDATHTCAAFARLLHNGDADTSFSLDGKLVLTPLCGDASLRVNAVKIDTAGRVVFAGSYQGDGNEPEFVVGRIKADGSGIDDTFGLFGLATSSFGGASSAEAAALALQSDGKIVAAGWATATFIGTLTSFAVLRLDANGGTDGGFGTNGYQIWSSGTSLDDPLNDRASAVGIQGDGKIVVAGTSQQTATGADFGIVRLNANGTFDTGFGTGGAKLVDFGGNCKDDIALAVAPIYSLFNPAGSGVVVAGTKCLGGNDWDYAVAVLDANGQPDTGFNGSGRRTVAFDLGGANRDVARAVSLESIGDLAFFPTHLT